MARVKVSIPDPLLQVAADAAHAAGKKIDDLYVEAIIAFIEANKNTRPGALRNHGSMPASAPKLTIEIPEALFEEAEKLGKRLGKRRDMIYALALATLIKYDANADTAQHGVHVLPNARGRPTGSGSGSTA